MSKPKQALIVVDVQNDFGPGGTLAVAHANASFSASDMDGLGISLENYDWVEPRDSSGASAQQQCLLGP